MVYKKHGKPVIRLLIDRLQERCTSSHYAMALIEIITASTLAIGRFLRLSDHEALVKQSHDLGTGL
jgi:hypothetical protein